MAWSGSGIFANMFIGQFSGVSAVDLTAETNMIALFGAGVTPNYATDTTYGTGTWGSANEASGPGYTAGGQALTGTTLTVVAGNPTWDADDPEWPETTIEAEGAAIYDPSDDQLIAGIWFGELVGSQDGLYRIAWAPEGIAVFDLTP